MSKPKRIPATTHTGANGAMPAKTRRALKLLDSWLADDSGYDEETWPKLKAGIEAVDVR
jgi:hypothetical protein